jgi:predicted tellurium resistance membrane protein TerC
MTKTISYTLTILILLTLTTALISNYVNLKIGALLILLLSGVKFIFVSFNFMELKKAHVFWKVLILMYLVLFITTVSLFI